MTIENRPRLPLPRPLRGVDRGSFAEYTVATRMPNIARRVPEENDLDEASAARMQELIEELPEHPVQPLDDPHAPDEADWNRHVEAIRGQTWLEVPWFFAETYFYRRIIAAVRYFGPDGARRMDPFEYQKRRGLEVTAREIEAAAEALNAEIDAGWSQEGLVRLLKADLWGNQVDLSLWPADDQNHPTHAVEDADAHLLVNDALATAAHVARRRGEARVDVILDNAGFELIGDLVLVDYLLTTSTARSVVLHVKLHPTFVSDATDADVRTTIDVLAAASHPHTRSMGERLKSALDDGRLLLRTHAFWTSPLLAWEMPDEVRSDLSGSDLVVSKGDANYRRLLGDLAWPLDTAFEDIVAYFPAPLVALRTYKSELGCGLAPERIAELNRTEKDWLTSGRWGIIQAAKLAADVALPATEVLRLASAQGES